MKIQYKNLMLASALIILIQILILWYIGINKSVYVIDENKNYLSANEVKELAESKIISTPNYKATYYSTKIVEYIKTRTLIPFIVKKDTLSKHDIEYWSIGDSNM